jgi:hypothetical protein
VASLNQDHGIYGLIRQTQRTDHCESGAPHIWLGYRRVEQIKRGATAMVQETWEAARLIPVSGIKGSDEQERRGSSALLAVLESVHEFNRAILGPLGAPAGRIECFIEVPFKIGEQTVRPDGLIRITRGNQVWVALVEVKTDRNNLQAPQLDTYLDVAREHDYQALITISNEIATVVGEHPCAVDKKKLKKVKIRHLSWSQIHTEAVIERVNRSVADPDQAWILAELIRYLEHDRSGAVDFDDMGSSWVSIRDGVVNGTLRTVDPKTLEVVGRFGQLIAFSGMRLSRMLGVEVRPALNRNQLNEGPKILQTAATELIESGILRGGLRVPNAVSPIGIVVDLKSGRATCSVTIDAPAQGRTTTRINWLMRQLTKAPADLIVEAFPVRARIGKCDSLAAVRESPDALIDDPKKDLKSFELRLSATIGTKRGQGRGSFVSSVLDLVETFYTKVVEELRPWTPPAPSAKSAASRSQMAEEDSIQGELPTRPGKSERVGSPSAVFERVGGDSGPDSVGDAGQIPTINID